MLYTGVNFDNLRKALYLLFFGVDNGACNSFDSPKYKYIIPIQGNFENPLNTEDANDTYIMFWIEEDRSLTQDDFIQQEDSAWNRQKCVAKILVRFVGAEAETWVRRFRHLTKCKGVPDIWSGVCNAEKLEYTSPIIPRRLSYFGKTNNIAFDVRFRLYYDECIETNWQPLVGVDLNTKGNITTENT